MFGDAAPADEEAREGARRGRGARGVSLSVSLREKFTVAGFHRKRERTTESELEARATVGEREELNELERGRSEGSVDRGR